MRLVRQPVAQLARQTALADAGLAGHEARLAGAAPDPAPPLQQELELLLPAHERGLLAFGGEARRLRVALPQEAEHLDRRREPLDGLGPFGLELEPGAQQRVRLT